MALGDSAEGMQWLMLAEDSWQAVVSNAARDSLLEGAVLLRYCKVNLLLSVVLITHTSIYIAGTGIRCTSCWRTDGEGEER